MYTKSLEILPIAVLVILLGVAVYTDMRYGKIYNKLTLPCMALGILLSVGAHGWPGLVESLGGILVVLVPFLLLAPRAGIGGGDTKLMMAVGSLLGFKLAVWAMLVSAIAGGALAMIVMLRHRALLSTTRNMAANVYLSTLGAQVGLSSGSKGLKFRYSPAIAFGSLVAVLYQLGR